MSLGTDSRIMVLLTMKGMSGRWDRQLPPDSFLYSLGFFFFQCGFFLNNTCTSSKKHSVSGLTERFNRQGSLIY